MTEPEKRGDRRLRFRVVLAVAASVLVALGFLWRVVIVDGDGPIRERLDWIEPSFRLDEVSKARAPSWIGHTVRRVGADLQFVGVSTFVPDLEAGIAEADDAALETIAAQISTVSVRNERWTDHVFAQYHARRRAAIDRLSSLAESSRRPNARELEAAREEVRTGRKRVATNLRRSGGLAIPKERTDIYWQRHVGPDGRRYRVALLYSIPVAVVEQLVTQYITAEEAMGVSAVTCFPSLGWRFDVDRCVVVTRVRPDSASRLAGLKEGDLVTAIDDIPIEDAGGFKKTVEVLRLARCRSGGDTVWKVKRGDTPPIEVRVHFAPGCAAQAPGQSQPASRHSQPASDNRVPCFP